MGTARKSGSTTFPVKPFLYTLFLAAIIINFLVVSSSRHVRIASLLNNYPAAVLILFSCIALVWVIFMMLSSHFKSRGRESAMYAALTLSPIILLLHANTLNGFLWPVFIVSATMAVFFSILSRQNAFTDKYTPHCKTAVSLLALSYFAVITQSVVARYYSNSLLNMADLFTYNEAFSNTLDGKFFQSTSYGSLFACHNTWFYMLLLPFYYVFPHPLTLLIAKTLLLSLSIIPFYLIARLYIRDIAIVPVTLAYMLYPYLISQNFAPAHEITYLPFFLLFTVYFFKTNRFIPFMIFLILCLSIKEHLALIAVMFGIYAFFKRKSLRWMVTPVLCGIIWGVFSILILSHFKQIYHSYPAGAWLIEDLKNRFLFSGGTLFDSLKNGLLTSNIANGFTMKNVTFHLLLPIGVAVPLLSPMSLLGAPELFINFLSDRPAMFAAVRHYNIVVSCFLLVGMVEGLKKIPAFGFIKKVKLDSRIIILLCSVLVLSSTLMYLYLW